MSYLSSARLSSFVAGGVGRIGQERELGLELGEDSLLQGGFVHGDQWK